MLGQDLKFRITFSLLLSHVLLGVRGHGHLWVPPQRSSMWRMGFSVPANYNDMGLNCGGFLNQWHMNGGKCGTCGDPYQGPHYNDNGGKYDTGVVGAVYKEGECIVTKINLTAFHRGYFQFHICEDGSLHGDQLQHCFDKNILPLRTKSGYRKKFYPQRGRGIYTVHAQLPRGLTCRRCVLQWVYRVGNSWGRDVEGAGLGHGPQEHFVNCADIRIRPKHRRTFHKFWPFHYITAAPNTTTPCTTHEQTTSLTTPNTTTTTTPKAAEICHPHRTVSAWRPAHAIRPTHMFQRKHVTRPQRMSPPAHMPRPQHLFQEAHVLLSEHLPPSPQVSRPEHIFQRAHVMLSEHMPPTFHVPRPEHIPRPEHMPLPTHLPRPEYMFERAHMILAEHMPPLERTPSRAHVPQPEHMHPAEHMLQPVHLSRPEHVLSLSHVPRPSHQSHVPRPSHQSHVPRPSHQSHVTQDGLSTCVAVGMWANQLDMTLWCQDNCPNFCPPTHCVCGRNKG